MKSLITRISRFLAVGLAAGALVGGIAVLAVPAQGVHAQGPTSLCNGVNSASGDSTSGAGGQGCNGAGYEQSGQNSGINALIKNILNIFSYVVGAISVIMIIVGGFRYIISAGDQNGVSGAKNTILYALVGLVVVIFAQVIVKFVISNVSKST